MPEQPAFLIPQLRGVLREAFEGPQESWSYFVDSRAGTGVFGTIETLGAAQVSHPSGAGDSTIAAHVHHVCFALADARAWIRGDHDPRDWSESWRVKTVDDQAWAELRARLRREYDDLLRAVETHALSSEAAFGGAVGVIAHVAYHLGAIRQKVAIVAR